MRSSSEAKGRVRQEVWDLLESEKLARFPFPPHGRIPNFAGARQAAERALALPLLATARRIKVNPDAPQRPLRQLALERGIVVYVPTPRLRGGFKRFDPARIPAKARREAASLSKGARFAEDVPLRELPRLDALVVGSVAVTRAGARCGKGEGYADIEYGILRELGHPPLPVLTTVHPAQIVAGFERDPTDLPIHWIVTPEAALEVDPAPTAPGGIEWSRLSEADLTAMPVLEELRPGRR